MVLMALSNNRNRLLVKPFVPHALAFSVRIVAASSPSSLPFALGLLREALLCPCVRLSLRFLTPNGFLLQQLLLQTVAQLKTFGVLTHDYL